MLSVNILCAYTSSIWIDEKSRKFPLPKYFLGRFYTQTFLPPFFPAKHISSIERLFIFHFVGWGDRQTDRQTVPLQTIFHSVKHFWTVCGFRRVWYQLRRPILAEILAKANCSGISHLKANESFQLRTTISKVVIELSHLSVSPSNLEAVNNITFLFPLQPRKTYFLIPFFLSPS